MPRSQSSGIPEGSLPPGSSNVWRGLVSQPSTICQLGIYLETRTFPQKILAKGRFAEQAALGTVSFTRIAESVGSVGV